MFLLLLLSLACSTEEPAEEALPADPPVSEVELKETPEERRERLNREADIRAGIDPDKPLPKWDFSGIEQRDPDDRDCGEGASGQLWVMSGGERGPGGGFEDLLAGPHAVTVASGRHKDEQAISLSALLGEGGGDVTAVNCRGDELALKTSQLPTLALVPNRNNRLKLIDLSEERPKPLLRDVVLIKR